MAIAQYKDHLGKWITIPQLGGGDVEKIAFEYCKQHGLLTRVAEDESKEAKILKEFKLQRRPGPNQ